MTYKYLRPSQVILDPENPRLPDGTSSDREAINQLLEEGPDALINLARDMAKTGQTNPAELPIAIQEGSKFLILEGNRRFAALKLLRDPVLAQSEEHQKAIRRAMTLGTPPKTVFTLVAASREEADHWIVLRHTGENDGRGVRRWSAGQAATHRKRANRSVDSGTVRSITMADELEEAYASDDEVIALIKKVRRGKLTNIGRFFSPDILERLHFVIQLDDSNSLRERILLTRHTREQLRDFFVWAFAFISAESVDAFKNRDIRKELLLSVPEVLPRDSDAAPQAFRLAEAADPSGLDTDTRDFDPTIDDEDGANSDPSGVQTAGSHSGMGTSSIPISGPNGQGAAITQSVSRKQEAKPEKYLLHNLRLPNHPPRIQKLLQECRSLEIEDKPSIACVMMRVIVELSVSCDEALNLSGKREGDKLREKILAMLRYLDPDIENPVKRDKELEQAYEEVSELGVQYLNGFVHSSKVLPDKHLARRFSHAFRPFLKKIDEKL